MFVCVIFRVYLLHILCVFILAFRGLPYSVVIITHFYVFLIMLFLIDIYNMVSDSLSFLYFRWRPEDRWFQH